MKNLTDIHNQLSAADRVYLEKRAEQIKIAEEEDAAGRIMARGFADELTKLAEGGFDLGKLNMGDGYGPRKPKAGSGGPSQMQQRRQTSAAAAQQAGGSSVNVVGAPGIGRRSSQQPSAAPKPPGGGGAPSVAGGPKPPGGGMTAMRPPKPPGMR